MIVPQRLVAAEIHLPLAAGTERDTLHSPDKPVRGVSGGVGRGVEGQVAWLGNRRPRFVADADAQEHPRLLRLEDEGVRRAVRETAARNEDLLRAEESVTVVVNCWAFIVVLLCWAPAASPAEMIIGKVVSIAAGDTLSVLVDREQIKVRLEGIEAPEKGQPYGDRAKQELGWLVFGKTVKVETAGKDRYGRTLASTAAEVTQRSESSRACALISSRRI